MNTIAILAEVKAINCLSAYLNEIEFIRLRRIIKGP